MANLFIVKGADFSTNAVDFFAQNQFELNTNENLLKSYSAVGNMSSGTIIVRIINFNAELGVGTKIKSANSSFYDTYKYAISTSQANVNDDKLVNFGMGTWDTSYSGSAYIQKDVTITTLAYYIYIARVDGATMTDEDVTTVNNLLKIIFS